MGSPLLFGANNTSNNLQNQLLMNNGALINANGTKNYITNGTFENGQTTGWNLVNVELSSGAPIPVGYYPALNSSTPSGPYITGYYDFLLSSAPAIHASVGDTYSNNGQTFTIVTVPSGSGTLGRVVCTGTGAPSPIGNLLRVTGSGTTIYSFSSVANTIADTNLSLSIISSGVLSGNYSASLNSSTASIAGNSLISSAFSIDSEDIAKVLSFKFSYKVVTNPGLNFSGTASNSFAVYIYDVANSVWIQPAGVYNLVQSTGVGISTGTFQTPSNSTQFQIALINLNASSGAYALALDNISVGPQITAAGAAISDWKSFTPVSSWTNNASTARWRRVGDSMHIQQEIYGTSFNATGTLTFGPPAGFTFDTSKVNTAAATNVGTGVAVKNGVGAYSGVALIVSSTTIQIYGPTAGSSWAPGIPFAYSTSDGILLDVVVPITGWSSNTVMSADTDTRVVAATAYLAAGSITPAANGILIFDTIIKDTTGSYSTSTGKYTAPVSGFYNVEVQTTAGAVTNINLYYNNSIFSNLCSPNGVHTTGAQTLYMNAGDTISINSSVSTALFGGTAPYQTYLSVYRLSGPATIAATETVAMQYNNVSGQSIANNSVTGITNWTKNFDSHNAFNATTGIFTAPVSGTYNLATSMAFNANGTGYREVAVTKNGTSVMILSDIVGSAANGLVQGGSSLFKLNAGDTLNITMAQTSGGALTIAAASNYCNLSISRIGN